MSILRRCDGDSNERGSNHCATPCVWNVSCGEANDPSIATKIPGTQNTEKINSSPSIGIGYLMLK